MTTFNEGDRLEVVEGCCSLLVGDKGTVIAGEFRKDETTTIHMITGNYASIFKVIEWSSTAAPVVPVPEAEYVHGRRYVVLADPVYRTGTTTTGNADLVEGMIVQATRQHSDGDFAVEVISSPGGGRIGRTEYVHGRSLRPEAEVIAEAAPTPIIEEGKVYGINRTARTASGGPVFYKPEVTRVRVQRLSGDNANVISLDGGATIGYGDTGYNDQANVGEGRTQLVGQEYLLVLPAAEIDSAEVMTLRANVERLRNELQATRDKHESDVKTISDRFSQEADERGWCEEYDRIVERLNEDLTVEMETREHEYEVTFTFSQTITVNARDEDSAVFDARGMYEYGRVDSSDEDGYTVDEA